jgi:hypothetical protein
MHKRVLVRTCYFAEKSTLPFGATTFAGMGARVLYMKNPAASMTVKPKSRVMRSPCFEGRTR